MEEQRRPPERPVRTWGIPLGRVAGVPVFLTASSLVLGLVAAFLAAVLPSRTLLEELAFQLALSNLVVAAFNVLPGLPLDGGRALRAGIWAVSHDRHLGDRVAGWVGRMVAVVSVAA